MFCKNCLVTIKISSTKQTKSEAYNSSFKTFPPSCEAFTYKNPMSERITLIDDGKFVSDDMEIAE